MGKRIKIISLPLGLIWLYRKFISPWIVPCCRFTPSCSEYASTALKKYGLFRGSILASYRFLRCQPFCQGGHDPVPHQYPLFKIKNGHDNEMNITTNIQPKEGNSA